MIHVDISSEFIKMIFLKIQSYRDYAFVHTYDIYFITKKRALHAKMDLHIRRSILIEIFNISWICNQIPYCLITKEVYQSKIAISREAQEK